MNSQGRKLLVLLVVMLAIGTAGFFGRKAYKRATERRLLSQASRYLEIKDVRNAALCLQRATQIDPKSVRASQLIADLFQLAGTPAELSWRMRASQLDPHSADLRYAWAETALKLGDLQSARAALDGLDDKTKSSAVYHKLAGALAWAAGSSKDAEEHYLAGLKLEPTNEVIRFNLNTIQLTSTNDAVADSARASLELMITNGTARQAVLHELLADALARKSLSTALTYSHLLAQDPSASVKDKIDHLQLLRKAKSEEYPSCLDSLKAEAARSTATAFALGQWMASADGPTNVSSWIGTLPANIQTNQPMPLLVADCRVALKDWTGLLRLVEKQNWGEANYFRLSLESLARRSQGEDPTWPTAWRKASQLAAHHLDRLTRLAELSSRWEWRGEYVELLRQITSEFPRERWAGDRLMAQFYDSGNSRELAELLAKMHAANPADPRLKNKLATISLLRRSDLNEAYRLAREAYDSQPNDPFCISTYAYALLLENKQTEASKVLGELKPEVLENPSIAALYGVVAAQTGHKDAARAPLERASSDLPLPEEKELVRLAKASL
jgi:predicted Zn-dependent protease